MKGHIIRKGGKLIGVSIPNPELKGSLTMTMKKGMEMSEFHIEDEDVNDPQKLSRHISKLQTKSPGTAKKKSKTKKR